MKNNEHIIRLLKKLYAKIILPISVILQELIRTTNERNFILSQTLIVNQVHRETFSEYKNKHNCNDIVIIATGPSLNKYIPLENTINIGVNKSFLYDKVKFDYYFAFDYVGIKDYIEKINVAEYEQVKKFYGIYTERIYDAREINTESHIIPESVAIRHNAKRFYSYSYHNHQFKFTKTKFFPEIDKAWLTDAGSIAIIAAQFALFTNPRKIYLVGCDCSENYFDNSKTQKGLSHLVKYWKDFKRFSDIYYPETEIISINPIGLKGIFTDLYQE